MSKLLSILARATDTKGYPDDKDPAHWRTINHAKVHVDAGGRIDGGAGKKFDGAEWKSAKHPHRPETYTKPKGAEDLKKAWAIVAKERMEIHRAKTEKSRKSHEEKLAKAYKDYTDMRAEIEARDPAEAAKFKPRTGSSAVSAKRTGLSGLAEATAPAMSEHAKGFVDSGKEAVKSYAEFKKSGKAADLEKAQEALTKATSEMDLIGDKDEAREARASIIEECKALGLESAKLRDLFKEIKTAAAPTAKSSLSSLAETTAGAGYTGQSEHGGCSPNADSKEISEWRKKSPTLKNFETYSTKEVKL